MTTLSNSNHSLIIIDSRITDYQSLINGFDTNADILILDPTQDGIQQIAEHLTNHQNLDAIHIVSHGNTGSLLLGSTTLTSNNLNDYLSQLSNIGNALSENGDLLLYGCDVAQGDIGQAFIEQLAGMTGADVAASDDLTGTKSLSGDWILEAQTGEIETTTIVSQTYAGTLLMQSNTFNLSANNLNMWGAGNSLNGTFTWETPSITLGNTEHIDTLGFTADYALQAIAGVGITANITSGSVDVGYDFTVNATKPDIVRSGENFVIDTSNWPAKTTLQTVSPSLSFEFFVNFGVTASLTNIQLDLPLLDPIIFADLGFDLPVDKYTLIEISPAYPDATKEFTYFSLGASLPDTIETTGTGGNSVTTEGKTDTPFLSASGDLDRIVAVLAGHPEYVVEYIPTTPDQSPYTEDLLQGHFGDKGDENATYLDYTLFDAQLNTGIYADQRFKFDVTSIGVTMTSSLGEVKTGELGDAFIFSTPSTGDGTVSVVASYTLNGKLTNESGISVGLSLNVTALNLELVIPNSPINIEIPGFSYPWNIASSDPLYLYNHTEKFSNLATANTTYTVNYSATATANGTGTLASQPNQQQVNFYGTPLNDNLYANDLDNIIYGYGANDVIYGFGGNDTIDAGSGSDKVIAGADNDTITVIVDGVDSVDGGSGIDSLTADLATLSHNPWGIPFGRVYWKGKDASGQTVTAVDVNSTFELIENFAQTATTKTLTVYGSGTDNIANLTFTNIENLSVIASSVSNDADLMILHGVGNYDGKGGNDALYADLSAATGDITFVANSGVTYQYLGSTFTNFERYLLRTGSGNDVIDNTAVALKDYLVLGAGNDTVTSGGGDDYVDGGEGNDVLNGGTGNDTLIGSAGNDVYVVDSTADVVTESNALDGIDTVQSSVTWTLGANLENLTLTGTNAINGTGNGLNNTLVGNSANNSLNGDLGDDSLLGNQGNDTLNGGAGIDSAVYSNAWVNYSVTGNATNATVIALNGNEGTDTLTNIENLVFNGVTVSVLNAINNNPIGVNDSNANDTVIEDTDAAAIGNVLDNDTDADNSLGLGETKTVKAINGQVSNVGVVVTGVYGKLILSADGSYTYTLDNAKTATNGLSAGQVVTDSFTYTVQDAHGLTGSAVLNINITGSNDAPTGSATAALNSGFEDIAYVIHASDLLQGFIDVDTGDVLSILNLDATHGSLTDNQNGTWTFNPELNYNGIILLKTDVVDTKGNSINARQSFYLEADNDDPTGTATGTLASGTINTAYTINQANLLQGFSDPDGDTLSIANLTATNGTLADNGNSTWTFTPNTGYTGSVSLNYTVTDNKSGTIAGALSFNINGTVTPTPTNHAPTGTASATLAAGTINTAYTINQSSLLQGFSDPDGDTLSIANLTATNGTLANNGNGTWTFTPNTAYTGGVSLNYSVTDGKNGTIAAVQAFNINKVAGVISFNVPNTITYTDTPYDDTFNISTGNLSASDSNGVPITYGIQNVAISGGKATFSNQYGTLEITNSTGAYTFTPDDLGLEALNSQTVVDFSVTASNGVSTSTRTLKLIVNQNGITETDGDDLLQGSANIDNWAGLKGNDSYYVNQTTDSIKENPNEGWDVVYSTVDYALGVNLESLFLQEEAIKGTGNDLSNSLFGNTQNNVLDGGKDKDLMAGKAGNDTYFVDDAGDVVLETGESLYDVVILQNYIGTQYVLSNNLYGLVASDTAKVESLVGNLGNNYLIGNANDNKLNGAGGIDILQGGNGNDTYYVYNNNTLVKEHSGEGIDTVYTTANGYILGDNIENLELHDSTAIATIMLPIRTGLIVNFMGSIAYGNALDNNLKGNGHNNFLIGGSGKDNLIGGNGDDIYAIDNIGDVVQENVGEGNDIVLSTLSHKLADNIEHLVLWGDTAIDGTGNELGNGLWGNDANNKLTGGDGYDLLVGGKGADTLDLTETVQATDIVRFYEGDSLSNNYDKVQGFKLGTGGNSTTGADALDLDSAKIANNGSIDGNDVGNIHSHNITQGLISFSNLDSYAANSAVTTSASNLNDILSYLQTNIAIGDTVAFVADGNTFVFQGGVVEDTVIALLGVSATGLSNSGLDIGSVALFSSR